MLNFILLVLVIIALFMNTVIFRELALHILTTYKCKPIWIKLLMVLGLIIIQVFSMLSIMMLLL